ncbi:MAG: non-canonical purine NTP pyrophosphatase [Gammaproteobacteria bacterium]
MDLLFATTNTNKLKETASILSSLGNFNLKSLQNFPSYCPPEETGNSFEENATIK